MHQHHAHVRLFFTLLTLVVLGLAGYVLLKALDVQENAIANPDLPMRPVVSARPSTTTPELIEVTGSTTPGSATTSTKVQTKSTATSTPLTSPAKRDIFAP